MLELGLLTPVLFLLFLSLVQIVIYLQSSTVTQYAAFQAARAYQVYGSRTLSDIQTFSHIDGSQTIAEAAAEKVIFESLAWEHSKIEVKGEPYSLERSYKDGNDLSINGVSATPSEGTVRVNLVDDHTGQKAVVTYCMPIRVPGLEDMFHSLKEEYPCSNTRGSRSYSGIAIQKTGHTVLQPGVAP